MSTPIETYGELLLVCLEYLAAPVLMVCFVAYEYLRYIGDTGRTNRLRPTKLLTLSLVLVYAALVIRRLVLIVS